MYEVSGLPMGELPYEEHVPGTEELHILKKEGPQVYKTYWELMCNSHICAQTTGLTAGGVKQMSWANYLFQDLENKMGPISRLAVSTDEEINERIFAMVSLYTIESKEDSFKPDIVFESFRHQYKIPILGMALRADFLMIWLKRCVVPMLPHEDLATNVVYPAILLAHGRPLVFLLTMTSYLQSELRALTLSFCCMEVMEDDEGNVILNRNSEPKRKTPNPRVEMSYTYLAA